MKSAEVAARRPARGSSGTLPFSDVSIDVRGAAPDAFNGAATQSVVFVGGGLSQPGVLDACLDNLAAPGGLVANAVMVEAKAILAQSYSRCSGTLQRFQHYHGVVAGA